MTLSRTVVAALAACAALGLYGLSMSQKAPPKPPDAYLQVTPSLSIKVAEDVPEDASLLCSKCYKPVPRREAYVIPTYNEGSQSYNGSYRCESDVKATIAETRAQYAAHDTDSNLFSFFAVLTGRGVTKAQLLPFTSGKDRIGAVNATLDALESRQLRPTP